MFYSILLTYFAVRFLGELLLYDEQVETVVRCRCDMCSGIDILN